MSVRLERLEAGQFDGHGVAADRQAAQQYSPVSPLTVSNSALVPSLTRRTVAPGTTRAVGVLDDADDAAGRGLGLQ